MVAVGIASQWIEMIPIKNGVDAQLIGCDPCLPVLLERSVLRLNLHADLDLVIAHAW